MTVADGGPSIEVVETTELEDALRDAEHKPLPGALPVLPLKDMVTFPDTPTCSMRLFFTTTSPRSMISSVPPFIVTTRALRNTTVPCGVARGNEGAISNRSGRPSSRRGV